MKILCLGKIMHELALRELAQLTAGVSGANSPDMILAGGDLLLGHSGAIRRLAEEWPDAGLHYLVLSDIAFARPAIRELLPSQPMWVRPANLPPGAVSARFCLWQKEAERLAIVSVVTDSERSIDDAFHTMHDLLDTELKGIPTLVLAYGADLSLKQALFWKLHQRVTPVHVLGLGLGVATADERVLSGRAWITDLGAVGRVGGIAGSDAEVWWKRHRERLLVSAAPPPGRLLADGLLLDVAPDGRVTRVHRCVLNGEAPV